MALAPYLALINLIKETFVRKSDTGNIVVEEILNLIRGENESTKKSICNSFAEKGVIEAFCKGLATSDPTIVCGILKVYDQLVPFGLLPTWKEIDISLEAIMRVVHIFLANRIFNVVSSGLGVMNVIIIEIGRQELPCTSLNIPHVLCFLRKVSKKESAFNSSIMDIIVSLLEGRFYEGHNNIFVEFMDVIMKDIYYWYQICSIKTLAKFILHGLKFFNGSQHVLKLSVEIVEVVFLKYLKGLMKNKELTENQLLLIEAIKLVFLTLEDDKRCEFALMLTAGNILQILQEFEFTVEWRIQTNLVRGLLVHILSTLCGEYLNSDGNDWEEKLLRAVRMAPPGAPYAKLFPTLNCPVTNVLPVIFNYFNLLLVKMPKVEKKFLNSMCELIAYHNEFTSGMLKAIWFIYAVAVMDKKDSSSQYILSTNDKLITLILNHNIELVFTRHPAMVFWTFKSVTNHTAFKKAILDEVLNHDNDCMEEIQELFSTDSLFRILCLKYLISCENEQKSTILTTVLFNPEKNTASIIVDIWHFLPKLISSKAFVGLCLKNLNSVLNYCLICFSMDLDKTLMGQIASALIKMIPTYFENSSSFDSADYTPSIEFLSFLINNKGEACIEKYFLDKAFLEIIELCLTGKEQEILLDIINIFIPLINFQITTELAKSFREIVITAKLVIKWLRGSKTLTRSTLKLLALYFRCAQTRKLVLKISYDKFDLISLYLELHEVCLKDEAYTSLSWICLREMLLYSKTIKYEEYIVELFHTNDLIDQSSSMSKSWGRILEFLKVWIQLLPPVSKSAIYKTARHKTIVKIASSFIQECKNESESAAALLKVFGDDAVVEKILSFIREK